MKRLGLAYIMSLIIFMFLLAALDAQASIICPAFGDDATCGSVITITNTGTTVSQTGQGPYEGSDDTLVGVSNQSSVPIKALVLSSGEPIFGFDGDGIDTYGAPGNSLDGTGYGGPDAYFTNINGNQGTVNFVTPIAPGGTTYFSLENALNTAVSCQQIVNGSVLKPQGGSPGITTTFTPNFGLTLAQAAADCGFQGFDWQQTITSWPSPSPLFQTGPIIKGISTPPSFLDPQSGGYTYNITCPNGIVSSSYRTANPFYYDPNGPKSDCFSVAGNENNALTTLSWGDQPADACLPGPAGPGFPNGTPSNAWLADISVPGILGSPTPIQTICPNLDPLGSQLGFQTDLVGLLAGGGDIDLGIGFTWTSSFNGTVGGTVSTAGDPALTVDPDSGTGDTTVTGFTADTTYQYTGGLTVTGVTSSVPEAPSGILFLSGLIGIACFKSRRRDHL